MSANKIKLSPEQEAFAKDIEATHYNPLTGMFFKKSKGGTLKVACKVSQQWVSYSTAVPMIKKIDFTSAQDELRPTDDYLWDQTISERDYYHEMADKLADEIARITGVDIGEHSSANCPLENALEAAECFDGGQEPEPDWKAIAQELAVALTEAAGALMSINTGSARIVIIDEDVFFAQRDEWCDWVKNEVAPLVSDAIKRAKDAGL